jgi:hypothetical protein
MLGGLWIRHLLLHLRIEHNQEERFRQSFWFPMVNGE